MHTLSTRDLTALAYERGEEFDPAMAPSPAVVAELSLGSLAMRPIEAPSPYERRREREGRRALSGVPEWLSAEDLLERPVGVHGELV